VPIDPQPIADDLRPGDLFELTDEFEHTFELCDTLAEAIKHAPDYGCTRIDVLRPTGRVTNGSTELARVHTLDLVTAQLVKNWLPPTMRRAR
jgi:hypothetical protein